MIGQRSEDIELPNQYDRDLDFGKNYAEEDDEEEGGITKKKKIIIVIAIISGVLIIGLIVFLVVFFSKKEEDGGNIIVKNELNSENSIKLLNVWNLKNGEYSIDVVNSDSSGLRLLDENTYSIENGILKFNDNKKRVGIIECKIKFKTVFSRLEGMFKDIKSLIKADFSEFKSENVKNMNELFKNCEKLAEVDFQKFNSKNVESMDSTFEGCKGLVELDLSHFETPKLKSMKSTFKSCENLEYLDMSKFDLNSNIVEIDNIFDGANNTNIKVDNSETNKLLQLNRAFNMTSDSNCEEGIGGKCKKCNTENKCEECNDGYYLYNSTNANKCQKCHENCENCVNSSFCTQCKNLYKKITIKEGALAMCAIDDNIKGENTNLIDSTYIEDATNNIPIIETENTNEEIESETDFTTNI